MRGLFWQLTYIILRNVANMGTSSSGNNNNDRKIPKEPRSGSESLGVQNTEGTDALACFRIA